MDKSHPINSPIVVRSLEVNKNPFRRKEENEELFDPKVPYLNAIGALMYLANCTRPDIAFFVNLLARYSSVLTKRHWNEIKYVLQYLRGTSDVGLYYLKESKSQLIGYVYAGYLLDLYKTRSQMRYIFTYGGMIIS